MKIKLKHIQGFHGRVRTPPLVVLHAYGPRPLEESYQWAVIVARGMFPPVISFDADKWKSALEARVTISEISTRQTKLLPEEELVIDKNNRIMTERREAVSQLY